MYELGQSTQCYYLYCSWYGSGRKDYGYTTKSSPKEQNALCRQKFGSQAGAFYSVPASPSKCGVSPSPDPTPTPTPDPTPTPSPSDIVPVDIGVTPQLVYLGQTGSGQIVVTESQYIPNVYQPQTTALAQFARPNGTILDEPVVDDSGSNTWLIVGGIAALMLLGAKEKKR